MDVIEVIPEPGGEKQLMLNHYFKIWSWSQSEVNGTHKITAY